MNRPLKYCKLNFRNENENDHESIKRENKVAVGYKVKKNDGTSSPS